MFILGTANFGNIYPGSKAYVDATTAGLIIDEFIKLGGTKLDTAEAYGKSLDIVQKSLDSPLQVSTKFKSELMSRPLDLQQYLTSLSVKFGSHLSTIYLHDIDNLDKIPENTYSILRDFLEENPLIKFGSSIYYPEEAYKSYDLFSFVSTFQCPLNYFDRRFISENFKKFCSNRNITIDYRSIFLQGRLLSPHDMINPYFKKFDHNI